MMLLALDLATVSGFAVGETDEFPSLTPLEAVAPSASRNTRAPISGERRIGRKGCDVGAFLLDYDAWLTDLKKVHGFQMVVYEAPLVMLRGKKKDRINMDTIRKLIGLANHTDFFCAMKGIGVFQANNASVRKHFIGRGNGPTEVLKRMTFAECQARGWNARGFDEADALAVFDFACFCLQEDE